LPPAGEWPRYALNRFSSTASLRTTNPDTEPGVFVLYVIEERDRRYAISVRGPQDNGELLADAEALAESFAILD